jgi:hypothetical protein
MTDSRELEYFFSALEQLVAVSRDALVCLGISIESRSAAWAK